MICEYCNVNNHSDFGRCEFCGAPLPEHEIEDATHLLHESLSFVSRDTHKVLRIWRDGSFFSSLFSKQPIKVVNMFNGKLVLSTKNWNESGARIYEIDQQGFSKTIPFEDLIEIYRHHPTFFEKMFVIVLNKNFTRKTGLDIIYKKRLGII